MVIDTVDQADSTVGHVRRADVFREHANFRVAHVFVFNSAGEILLQRLSVTRDRNPGRWGSSVAAYLFASESYSEAARRRLREELGVSARALVRIGKTEMVDDGCLKFIALFQSTSDGPFHFDRSHIDSLEFVPVADVGKMIEQGSRRFTPTFVRVFEFYRSLRPIR